MNAAPAAEPIDAAEQFLRACARVEQDEEGRTRVRRTAAQVTDWNAVSASADQHGLIPLVWHHARAGGIDTSAADWRRIGALVVRWREVAGVQAEALAEAIDALDAAGIEHVLLKGAILAHVLYPRPDLRCMTDLDVLVSPHDMARVPSVLSACGFDAPAARTPGVQRFHHHLPPATRRVRGVHVTIEVHHDALSGDQAQSLRLPALTEPPREVIVAGRRLRGFGHVDMLVHLCAHLLEPGLRTRLIGVADLLGYAARYASDVDWDLVRRRHPRVLNAITLMHYLTPLPEPLHALRPAEALPPPPGVGRGMTPLSGVAAAPPRIGRAMSDLLYPSEWWMRAYYGVPPGQPLFAVRWGRHLRRLAYWGGRRAVAAAASLTSAPAA